MLDAICYARSNPAAAGTHASRVVPTAAPDRRSHQRRRCEGRGVPGASPQEASERVSPRYLRTGQRGADSHTKDIRQSPRPLRARSLLFELPLSSSSSLLTQWSGPGFTRGPGLRLSHFRVSRSVLEASHCAPRVSLFGRRSRIPGWRPRVTRAQTRNPEAQRGWPAPCRARPLDLIIYVSLRP